MPTLPVAGSMVRTVEVDVKAEEVAILNFWESLLSTPKMNLVEGAEAPVLKASKGLVEVAVAAETVSCVLAEEA